MGGCGSGRNRNFRTGHILYLYVYILSLEQLLLYDFISLFSLFLSNRHTNVLPNVSFNRFISYVSIQFQLNIIDACVDIVFLFHAPVYACVREKCCLYGKQWLEQLHDSIDKPISKLKNEMRNTVPEPEPEPKPINWKPSGLVAHLCRKGQFTHNERMQDEWGK